jgi:hypothetical protein
MTDILGERLGALADFTDDGDWLEVERRARRPRRRVALAAVLAAAVLTAAALAATGTWRFARSGSEVRATSSVAFQGRRWHVTVSSGTAHSFCVRLGRPNGAVAAQGCGVFLVRLSRVVRDLHTNAIPRFAQPFGGLRYRLGNGEIWFGTARSTVAEIRITDDRGAVHRTRTVTAPASLHTSLRFWVLALDPGTGRRIDGYGRDGRLVARVAVSADQARLRP